MRLVISDQHAGLVAALRRCFQGASHQRCRVHFARNLLALVPKSHQDMVAAVFRTIFAQPDPDTVASTWDQVRDQLGDRFPKIAVLMDDAKAEVLAFTAFPRAHWTKIWSTNPLERLNKEVKRRARVVGIFPNDASVIRLVGAVLADVHDEWQAGDRRYLSEGSMALLYPERDTDHVADSHPATDTEDHLEAHHSVGRRQPVSAEPSTCRDPAPVAEWPGMLPIGPFVSTGSLVCDRHVADCTGTTRNEQ